MLGAGECAVWWADPRHVGPEGAALLDPVERDRAAEFRFAVDRDRFVAGAVLLRAAVTEETGMPPQDVSVDRSCPRCGAMHGRPRLPDPGLHVSVTHAVDRVGVALTRAGPVGIDVEHVGRDLSHLAAEILGPRERADAPAELYVYWTRKESVVKATGAGLGVGLAAVRVSAPRVAPRLLDYPGAPDLVATMYDLAPGSGYVGSVTVLAAGPVILRERFSALSAYGRVSG